jgi:hypothetical protein
MKELKRQVYEYYDDFSLKKITFFKKGKADYYTIFNCNPIGQNKKPGKDSTYTCIKYDIDSSGNKTKVTLTNERGYSTKVVEHYNKADERFAIRTYDLRNENMLLWEYYYEPGTDRITKFVSFRRKKEYYKMEYSYNSGGLVTEISKYSRKRFSSKLVHSYNDKGLMISTTEYNKRKHKSQELNYSYEYF